MALAATRCLDSLCSCSSVHGSSWGMAASAPTCIFIFTCFCFATAVSLELEQLEQSAGLEAAPLDLHLPPGHPGQRRAAATIGDLGEPSHERGGRELHDVRQRAADHDVGGPVVAPGVLHQ